MFPIACLIHDRHGTPYQLRRFSSMIGSRTYQLLAEAYRRLLEVEGQAKTGDSGLTPRHRELLDQAVTALGGIIHSPEEREE
jgi:hypothetical protein